MKKTLITLTILGSLFSCATATNSTDMSKEMNDHVQMSKQMMEDSNNMMMFHSDEGEEDTNVILVLDEHGDEGILEVNGKKYDVELAPSASGLYFENTEEKVSIHYKNDYGILTMNEKDIKLHSVKMNKDMMKKEDMMKHEDMMKKEDMMKHEDMMKKDYKEIYNFHSDEGEAIHSHLFVGMKEDKIDIILSYKHNKVKETLYKMSENEYMSENKKVVLNFYKEGKLQKAKLKYNEMDIKFFDLGTKKMNFIK